ncbi:LLM class flavin-dependent oxidoreductase [Streptomyces sp. NBC_00243]|uniref:LLM class flavin-dependent oxidoreductase n=1 Tax=Streptomyces sp. NBC_00243 TaxID=2975688 RepID=UPI002DD98585|nr:LLM class flavin-dependent oxidoreductase [Streptomyces sp. NBC_00243]WRZ22664.1 LLM class flavin-dependent oxidoreductase [Streptomyces sp. NBC_00243]
MPDYGHDLLFGAVLTPDAGQPHTVIELARLADRAGLDLVSVADHPYRPDFLDAWTLLSVIAARTERVRVFPNVANLPLRPPAGLARAAASLDVLSGGRVELGLGAGGYWDAIASEGQLRRTPGEAVEALGEAIDVIRALWSTDGNGGNSGNSKGVGGKHYWLDGARPGPAAVHPIRIWVGALGPRMLRLIGRSADGWLPSATRVPPAELAVGQRIVDEAATAAGRDPRSVRRLYNLPGLAPAEQLAELTLTQGVSAYLLASDDPSTLERFAHEVAPAVVELVAKERTS